MLCQSVSPTEVKTPTVNSSAQEIKTPREAETHLNLLLVTGALF